MNKKWLWACLCLTALCSTWASAATGKIVYTEQESWVEVAGKKTQAQPGMTLTNETVSTGATGLIQLQMTDGTLIAIPALSEVFVADGADTKLGLLRGGLRLTTPSAETYWQVQAAGRNIKASGYLKLNHCADGCTDKPGVYGRGFGGEVIVEYEGGRSALNGKVFRIIGNARPEVLAKAPTFLDGQTNHSQATLARREVSKRLIAGIESFQGNDFTTAKSHLLAVAEQAPSETVVSYYLGLIALAEQDNPTALRLLQKYLKDDPQAALEREVPKTITLLSTSALQQEVANAIAQEKSISSAPPEPNSIAVQTFASQGDPIYRAMAKGIAAVVIADLSQVPGIKVLEREKVQKLMAEMKLGDSGLAEETTAVRTGRLMRAEKVIVGSFGAQ